MNDRIVERKLVLAGSSRLNEWYALNEYGTASASMSISPAIKGGTDVM